MADIPQTQGTPTDALRPGQEVTYQGRRVYLSDKKVCPVCKRQNFCPSHAYAFVDWYRGYVKRFAPKMLGKRQKIPDL